MVVHGRTAGRYLSDRRHRRVRVLARRGSRAVTYRGRLPALLLLLALAAAAITTGTITGHVGTAAIAVARRRLFPAAGVPEAADRSPRVEFGERHV